tara:strand:+ start:450 stop:707 length:258 start_codon:yes stop_codon:yes gene_type:complete
MGYKNIGKKSEQRKTFNLKISWVDDEGEEVSKRYFTKPHACRELGISYISITRILRGDHVEKYSHYKIEAIKEPAQVIHCTQLYE